MKKSLAVMATTVGLCAAIPSFAAGVSGLPYIGVEIGGAHVTIKDQTHNTGVDTSGNNANADAYFGYAFSKYLSVQFNLGTNTSKVEKTTSAYRVRAKFINYESLYVKGTVPFQGRWSVYGLAGYTTAKVQGDVSGNGNSATYDSRKGSFSYGVGLELYGAPSTALTLAYNRLFNGKVGGVKVTYDTASIGLIHYFNWPALG